MKIILQFYLMINFILQNGIPTESIFISLYKHKKANPLQYCYRIYVNDIFLFSRLSGRSAVSLLHHKLAQRKA